MNEIAKLLDIQKDEQKPVLLLLIHSFFIGIFLSFFFSVANGAFLKAFPIKWLPFAYIASGLTGYAISSIFSYLQKKISYRLLLLGVLLTLLALMGFFTLSLMNGAETWIAFVMFMWVGPFYSMIALQFWSMAMKMFDLRQAKRLFGLLGTGDVISSLIGFASVPAVLALFDDGGGEIILLILGMGGLTLGVLFQLKIFSMFSEQLSTKKTGKSNTGSMREVLKNKYFLLIFAVTFCSVLGQYFVDYNFMSLSKSNFQKSELTAFIGSFFAIIKMVEFIVKTFMAGRFLKNYGLLSGLLLLPFLMLIFTAAATLLQVFGASASLIFVPLAMNKLFDRSLRKAIDDPSVKVMYQPLDPETKLSVQTQAEGKAKQIGIMVAGIILITFNYIPEYNILAASIVLLAALLSWTYYARQMYQKYRATIREKLISDTHNEHQTNKFAIHFLRNAILAQEEPEAIVTALRLAERVEQGSLARYWPQLLDHPAPEVRRLSVKLISQNYSLNLLPNLKEGHRFEQDENAQALIEEAIIKLEKLQLLSANRLVNMVRSAQWQDRQLAAVWLAYFEHPQKLLFLRELAGDKQIEVATAAIRASSSVKSVELWSLMIDYLSVADIGNVSVPALVAEGEELVSMLDIAFSKMEDKPLTQLKIIQICGRIGGKQSQKFLIDKINYPNREVQILVAEMLVLSVYRADANTTAALKQQLLSECNYATWLLACQADLKQSAMNFKYFIQLLTKNYEETRTHIFRILSLIYDADSIERIEQNLDKGTKEGITLALEMIDILVDEDIKGIISIVAERISLADKYTLLSQYFPQMRFTDPIKRLQNILYEDFSKVDRWLKASAIDKLMELAPDKLSKEVHALAFSKDFLLKEMALINIHQVDPELYNRYTLTEKKRDKIKYDRVTGYHRRLARIPSNFDEVVFMTQNAFLNRVPETLLVKLSELMEQEVILAGHQPGPKYRKGNNIHFIIEGHISLTTKQGETIDLASGDAIGLLDDIDLEACYITVHEDTKVFYLQKQEFYAIAQVHFELVHAVYDYLLRDVQKGTSEQTEEVFEENLMTTAAP